MWVQHRRLHGGNRVDPPAKFEADYYCAGPQRLWRFPNEPESPPSAVHLQT
jgi:hypothetical protein